MNKQSSHKLKIDFFELKRRDPIEDIEEIKWMIAYKEKYEGRTQVKRTLLFIKQIYWELLKEAQAFEFMELLSSYLGRKDPPQKREKTKREKIIDNNLQKYKEAQILEWNTKTAEMFKKNLCMN